MRLTVSELTSSGQIDVSYQPQFSNAPSVLDQLSRLFPSFKQLFHQSNSWVILIVQLIFVGSCFHVAENLDMGSGTYQVNGIASLTHLLVESLGLLRCKYQNSERSATCATTTRCQM